MMKFRAPTLEDFERSRCWRNTTLESLRTPFLLTKEMQERFYRDVICDRRSNVRFWTVERDDGSPIAHASLVNIEWENRLAEMGIMMNPDERGLGYGERVVDILLQKAFYEINLENIYAECYFCSPAVGFWRKIITKYKATTAVLPNRKYWDGKYWDSLYFNIEKERFDAREYSCNL